MHVAISTFGSRGDVQPFLALAVGLQQAGHQVTLVTSHTFSDWIQSYGIDVRPVDFDPQDALNHPEMQAFMRKGGNHLRVLRVMREELARALNLHDEFWEVVQSADFVVQASTSVGALEATELLNIPSAIVHLFPFSTTREFPSFFLGALRSSLGPGYNQLTHRAAHQLVWKIIGAPMSNQWRQQLGLRAWRSYSEMYAQARQQKTPILCAFSPSLLPKPADWDANHFLTGYWFLDRPPTWQPPAELVHFLESGPPPVYIGYGSMNAGDGEEKTQLILRALELSGQRGILLSGWGGLAQGKEAENVFYIENIPHDRLFPQMAAVVHHGGAGSTAAGIRAGIPSLVTPVAADQYAWAEQVIKAGVGPRMPDRKSLTAENLAEGIQVALNNQEMRSRAAQLGNNIRAENGVEQAIKVIERHAAQFRT